jgi:hypothetical protein
MHTFPNQEIHHHKMRVVWEGSSWWEMGWSRHNEVDKSGKTKIGFEHFA